MSQLSTKFAKLFGLPNGFATLDGSGNVPASELGNAVTSVSVSTANGFAGSSSGGSTPALTLTTTITGLLQGNGTAISAASVTNLTDVGTDGITITNGTSAVLGASPVTISQHVADTAHNGYLSSTDWNTFNNKQSTITLTNLTDVGTDGITITNGTGAVVGSSPVTISQHVADTTHNGYLSSTDWNTFNGKQAAGNYITALTGDATASGPGSAALTLATVNANVGSFTVSSITVNAKGLITAASSGTTGNLTEATSAVLTITGGTGAVLGSGTSIQVKQSSTSVSGYLSNTDWNTFNGKQAAGNYITALTGDATASGPGSAALTLATVNTNTGSFGSSTAIPSFTVNGKGLITAASTNAVIAPAGTLTGTTLASNVVSSSLTSVGTITTGVWNGTTIAVANGGTGQTSYTDGQLLIGNTSGNTLTKSTLTAGTNITITNGNGSITVAASSSASPAYNYTSQTTTYNAVVSDYIVASGASFTITLPTAVGQSGKSIVIQHGGTSLSQQYTLNTASAQTIGGIASGSYVLNTNAEVLIVTSDGANWLIQSHVTDAAPAATWTPMFATKFTVTAANATSGATYTNNSQTFYVVGTISGGTTLQTVGTGNATASGTLTKATGTGDSTITFSASANSNGTVTSVNAWWMRYSNRMKAWGSFLPGTPTANLWIMGLPGGTASTPVAIDTTFVAPSANTSSNAGMRVGTLQGSGAANAFYNIVLAPGTSSSAVFDANVSSGTTQLTPQTAQTGITSGDLISWDFDIPISGWQP